MIIKSCKEVDVTERFPQSYCKVYLLHVQIDDVEERAAQMIQEITSTSWITKLAPVDRVSFTARAKATITKLANEILAKVSTTVTEEFGEYMVSMSAQDALFQSLQHSKIPLAELFKEQKSGNPGFDFHTESSSCLVAFGEAKYSGSENPYTRALSQVVSFIDLAKDDMELTDLKCFVSEKAIQNALNGDKAYIAAFSINTTRPDLIFNKVLKSDLLTRLVLYPELYLIGVEVNDSATRTGGE